MLYPVKNKGSYNHLTVGKIKPSAFGSVMARISYELDMTDYGLNAVESTLCETYPDRGPVWDLFIKGQNLYLLGSEGQPQTKKYGQVAWSEM